jgi:hypothetical protein
LPQLALHRAYHVAQIEAFHEQWLVPAQGTKGLREFRGPRDRANGRIDVVTRVTTRLIARQLESALHHREQVREIVCESPRELRDATKSVPDFTARIGGHPQIG